MCFGSVMSATLISNKRVIIDNRTGIFVETAVINDTTLDNIKGICYDCCIIVPSLDLILCGNCKLIRKQKVKEWLGIATAVVGRVYSLLSARKMMKVKTIHISMMEMMKEDLQ